MQSKEHSLRQDQNAVKTIVFFSLNAFAFSFVRLPSLFLAQLHDYTLFVKKSIKMRIQTVLPAFNCMQHCDCFAITLSCVVVALLLANFKQMVANLVVFFSINAIYVQNCEAFFTETSFKLLNTSENILTKSSKKLNGSRYIWATLEKESNQNSRRNHIPYRNK